MSNRRHLPLAIALTVAAALGMAACGTASDAQGTHVAAVTIGTGKTAQVVTGTAGAGTGASTDTTASTTATTSTAPTTSTAASGGTGDPVAGKAVFASAGCGGCHTLSAAGAAGNVGPNLDQVKPSMDKVVSQVTNGGGAMQSFSSQLSAQQIQDVAAFVSQNAGK